MYEVTDCCFSWVAYNVLSFFHTLKVYVIESGCAYISLVHLIKTTTYSENLWCTYSYYMQSLPKIVPSPTKPSSHTYQNLKTYSTAPSGHWLSSCKYTFTYWWHYYQLVVSFLITTRSYSNWKIYLLTSSEFVKYGWKLYFWIASAFQLNTITYSMSLSLRIST